LFIKKFIPCITLLLLVASCIYNPLSEYSTPELVIALQSTDAGERENAARVLETRGRDAKDAIPFLVEALFDSDEHVQIAARDALVSIGPEAVESLFFAIQNGFVKEGQKKEVSNDVSEGIFLFDADAIPAFVAIYNQSEVGSVEREGVISVLNAMVERIGTDAIAAAPTLISSMGDPSSPYRVKSIQSLTTLGHSILPELIKGLGDQNTEVRYNCAVVLGRIGPDALEAGPMLIITLDDPVVEVRAAAQYALKEIGFPFKYSPSPSQRIYDLIAALRSPNAIVRAATAEALGNMGSEAEAALPALRQALKDPNQGVRLAAEEAIKKIQVSP
jgi:HEAT repeat protein